MTYREALRDEFKRLNADHHTEFSLIITVIRDHLTQLGGGGETGPGGSGGDPPRPPRSHNPNPDQQIQFLLQQQQVIE